jgi:hypothetical protein
MRNLILLILVLNCGLTYSQDIWVQKDSVKGSPRSAGATFVANGQGFVCTGYDGLGKTRKNRGYNFWQDDWNTYSPLAGLLGDGNDRSSATGFDINGKGYICLGATESGDFSKDLWEYNATTDSWTSKADFIGSSRREAIAFTIEGKAYVGTGQDINGFTKDMYAYDPSSNTWTQVSDFGGTARTEAVGFSIGVRGYVGTGDDGVRKKDFWEYNPSTDTWTPKADFPGTARKAAVGWGVYPQGFICTGDDANLELKNDLWEYNTFSNSWVQRADFPASARSNSICFSLNGYGFVGMGYDGTDHTDDFYSYIRIVGGIEGELDQVTCYPNPTTDVIKIGGTYAPESIKVHSAMGREVTMSVYVNQTSSKLELNVTELSAGEYYFNAKDELSSKPVFTKFRVIK